MWSRLEWLSLSHKLQDMRLDLLKAWLTGTLIITFKNTHSVSAVLLLVETHRETTAQQ